MPKKIFSAESYLPGHELTLVPSGEPYFIRLLQMIREAKKEIQFQTYIFDEDNTGKEIAEALMAASRRGVEIFLTLDSYGSKSLSPEFIAGLQNSGIHFKYFSPIPRYSYVFGLGRRLHSKVVVADETVALVGGVNIADKYRGNARETPWLDFALDIKGPVCADLALTCARIFSRKFFFKRRFGNGNKPPKGKGKVLSRLAVNDWLRRKNQISAGYRAAFRQSTDSITLMASYFLPSRSLRRTLTYAARRGVRITLLLPGESDVPMAKSATRYLYRWLLRNNIRIYEWHDSILHGKLAVVDHKWITAGSFNLNHLSQYSSIEMNLEVLDNAFATTVEENLSPLLEKSIQITTVSFDHNEGILNKIRDWASYTLARWMMMYFFYLVQRDHRSKEKE